MQRTAAVAGLVFLSGCGATDFSSSGPPIIRTCHMESALVAKTMVYNYQWDVKTNGDKAIYCSVDDATGANYSECGTSVYCPAGALCWAKSICFVNYDVDDPNSGGFRFLSDPAERVIYIDPGSAYDNVSIPLGIGCF